MTTRIAALACLFLAGCGGSSAPLENKTDSDRARSSLETALRMWQNGEPYANLQSQQPPIFMNDEDWSRGRKLTHFEIAPGEPYGIGMRFNVTLTIDNAGKSANRKIKYRVYTDPQLSIARDDT